MRDTLIMAVTVGVFAMLGNMAGGYFIASRLSHLAVAGARPAAATSAEVAYSRLVADRARRDHS